jgi:hypothetical protein
MPYRPRFRDWLATNLLILAVACALALSLRAADAPVPHVKLTTLEIMNVESAFMKVYRAEVLGAQRLRIGRWGDPIFAEMKRIEAERAKFGDAQHADPTTHAILPAFAKTWADFLLEKIDIPLAPLSAEDLDDVKLSAADIAELRPLLSAAAALPAPPK